MNAEYRLSEHTTLEQFKALHTCLIDTSSLIYLNRLGVTAKLGSCLTLITIPEVAAEFGILPDYIHLVSINVSVSVVDKKLLACAIHFNWPLISEDKDLLKPLNKEGLPHFNALMMIYFLFFKGMISPPDCRALVAQLKTFARYSQQIWTYGQVVAERLGLDKQSNLIF
jgi:hypothetical protein